MLNHDGINKIDSLVKQLSQEKDEWMSMAIAIDLADEIMKGLLPNKEDWHQKLNHDSQHTGALPKPLPMDIFHTQKQRTWFHEHPESNSARVALQHFRAEDCAVESKFFWFSESATKQKISASTEFTSNWEDSDLTRKPNNKVGIDFFLTDDANSLLLVLSNRQKHRVMELHGHLSNTQKQIFEYKLNGAASYDGIKDEIKQEFEPQRTIHQTLWNALQLKEVNKQFYAIVAKFFDDLVKELSKQGKNAEDAKQFSARLLGRLLFIWFLRKMEIIHEEFGYFEMDGLSATDYYEDKVKLLFFNTLNTDVSERIHQDYLTPYLNGGLFEPKENDFEKEKIAFPDDYFKNLFDRFNEFNFTTDESSADFEMIAVDPEMLGQVFESLLASQIDANGANERNRTGAFYTPREIVDYMCRETLRHYLYSKVESESFKQGIDFLLDFSDAQFLARKSTSGADLWGVNSKKISADLRKALDEFTVIDPACGSGAYPMGMLQLLLRTYERLSTSKNFDTYDAKLKIIENSIFGVDIQPMAVEISRLRAWLSVIVDEHDKSNIQPLPNLDFKFVCANTLVDLEEGEDNLFTDNKLSGKLADLRDKYFNARKPNTKHNYQEKYYKLTEVKLFDGFDKRAQQLKTFDPFVNRYAADFYDSAFMFGVNNGFDAVIGNPPYIHFEKMKTDNPEMYKLYREISPRYKTYAARGDIYTMFYEKALELLKDNGVFAFITSNKWMRAGYGSKLRNYFLENSNPLLLIDLGAGIFDSATVDTNILISEKAKNAHQLRAVTLSADGLENMSDYVRQNVIDIDYKLDDPWVILSQIEQSIKHKIESVGTPLKDWDIRINYGIKTGLNDAFIISKEKRDELVKADPKSDEIIRPILRGRDISKNSYEWAGLYIIATFPSRHYDIDDFPAVRDYLLTFDKRKLEQSGQKDIDGIKGNNARKKTNNRWFETQDSIAYWDDFSKPKIIYPETVQRANFSLDNEGILVDKTCFIIVGDNLEYLQKTLSSQLFEFAYKRLFSSIELGAAGFQYNKHALVKLPVKTFDNQEVTSDCDIFSIYNLSEEEINFISSSVNPNVRSKLPSNL